MKKLRHRLIPDLEKLAGLVMTTPTGVVRFSIKAKEILAPIFEANGLDIANVATVTQYNLIKDIVDNRIAIDLAHAEIQQPWEEIVENLDRNLDLHNPVDHVYAEARTNETEPPPRKKLQLRLIKK